MSVTQEQDSEHLQDFVFLRACVTKVTARGKTVTIHSETTLVCKSSWYNSWYNCLYSVPHLSHYLSFLFSFWQYLLSSTPSPLSLPSIPPLPSPLLPPPPPLQPPASHHTQFTCSSSQLSHNLAALCMQMQQFYCSGMDKERTKSRLKRFFSFRR